MFKIKERNEFTQGLKSLPCPFNFSRRDDGMNFKMHLGSALLASVWFRCTCKCNKTDLSRMHDESVSRIHQYWLTLSQNFVCKNLFKPVAVPIWDVRHRVVAAGGDRGIKHTPPTSAIPTSHSKLAMRVLQSKQTEQQSIWSNYDSAIPRYKLCSLLTSRTGRVNISKLPNSTIILYPIIEIPLLPCSP